MSLPQGNNIVDIDVLNANINVIDNGLSPFYVATQSGANTYKVITGANKTTLANGYGIRVAIPTPSDGAVSIIVDGCSAVPVKKANGNPVKNFKPSGVYSLTYYNSAFFLSSGGADESDSTTVGTDGSKVLFGETFIGSDGEIHTGKIRNRTAVNTTLEAGQSIILYSGYYKDKSTIKAETLATAMANAGSTLTSASQLVSGVKAVDKNGNLITGTATIESLGGLRYMTGTTTINNALHENTYDLPLSQLNLPRTPKFVVCNWRITWYRRVNREDQTGNASSYTFFDFINSKCSYPTNTMWSHEGGSGTYKEVDTIRKFK